MILDIIKSKASGILLGIAFISGATAATIATRYVYLNIIEAMQARQVKIDSDRQNEVIKRQAELIAEKDAEIAKRLKAEEGNRNANEIIDHIMRDADARSGVRIVSVKGVCDARLPQGGEASGQDITASDLFDYYDRSLETAHAEIIEAVASCERDRESVIMQCGGR